MALARSNSATAPQLQAQDDRPGAGRSRHLEAVDAPIAASKSDPKRQFLVVYNDVLSIPGLGKGAALLYSFLVQAQGDAADGRRKDNGQVYRYTQRQLQKHLGASVDEITAWTKALRRPYDCAFCPSAHPLIRTNKPYPTARLDYTVLKCYDVTENERWTKGEVAAKTADRHELRARGGRFAPAATTIEPEQTDLLAELSGNSRQVTPASTGGVVGVSPTTHATSTSGLSRRALILKLSAEEFEDTDVPDEVLERLAGAQAPGMAELETLLIATIRIASDAPITIAHAERAIVEVAARDRAREEDVDVATGDAEYPDFPGFDALFALWRKREPKITAAAVTEFYRKTLLPACKRECAGDDVEAILLAARLAEDPRIVRHENPIATLRIGLKDRWIFTPPQLDNGSGALERAFARLPAGSRDEAERMIRAGDFNREKLRNLGVGTTKMVDYLRRRFTG